MIKNTSWIAGIFVLALLCIAGAAAQDDTGLLPMEPYSR